MGNVDIEKVWKGSHRRLSDSLTRFRCAAMMMSGCQLLDAGPQAGLVLTILFVPNLMSLDLREGDRRFDALMAGNPAAYSGDAVHPSNLSLFERMLGVQK